MKKAMKKSKVLDQLIKYIHSRDIDQLRELSIKDFARRYHLNYCYLSRIFRVHTHITLKEFLLREKIERSALFLMENQGKSVREVCEKIGFAESRYFIKVFRRFKDVSPGRYRKMHANTTKKKQEEDK